MSLIQSCPDEAGTYDRREQAYVESDVLSQDAPFLWVTKNVFGRNVVKYTAK